MRVRPALARIIRFLNPVGAFALLNSIDPTKGSHHGKFATS